MNADAVLEGPGTPAAAALLGGRFAPIGWTIQFIEDGRRRVVETIESWRTSLAQQLEVNPAGAFPDCLGALEPLESPWTKELLVEAGDWTMYLNNQHDVGDPTASAPFVAERLGVRCLTATHQPLLAMGHGSTQMRLQGPAGEQPLMYIRTAAAHAEDGRWSWEESGEAQPFEEPERYGADRVRDRLTRAMLVRYLSRLGINLDDDGFFGDSTQIHQLVGWPTDQVTLAEQRVKWGLSSSA